MINVIFPNTMTAEVFIGAVNKARLTSKDRWVAGIAEVDGMYVEYKAYNTWLQIYKVDGVDYSGGMGAKVSEYKDTLYQPFKDKENAA